jgi:hypothetical protein
MPSKYSHAIVLARREQRRAVRAPNEAAEEVTSRPIENPSTTVSRPYGPALGSNRARRPRIRPRPLKSTSEDSRTTSSDAQTSANAATPSSVHSRNTSVTESLSSISTLSELHPEVMTQVNAHRPKSPPRIIYHQPKTPTTPNFAPRPLQGFPILEYSNTEDFPAGYFQERLEHEAVSSERTAMARRGSDKSTSTARQPYNDNEQVLKDALTARGILETEQLRSRTASPSKGASIPSVSPVSVVYHSSRGGWEGRSVNPSRQMQNEQYSHPNNREPLFEAVFVDDNPALMHPMASPRSSRSVACETTTRRGHTRHSSQASRSVPHLSRPGTTLNGLAPVRDNSPPSDSAFPPFEDEPYFGGSSGGSTNSSMSDISAADHSIQPKTPIPVHLPRGSAPYSQEYSQFSSISRGHSPDDAAPPPISRIRHDRDFDFGPDFPITGAANRQKSSSILSSLTFWRKKAPAAQAPRPAVPQPVSQPSRYAAPAAPSSQRPSLSLGSLSRRISIESYRRGRSNSIMTQAIPYEATLKRQEPIPTEDARDLQPVSRYWKDNLGQDARSGHDPVAWRLESRYENGRGEAPVLRGYKVSNDGRR